MKAWANVLVLEVNVKGEEEIKETSERTQDVIIEYQERICQKPCDFPFEWPRAETLAFSTTESSMSKSVLGTE